MATSFEEKDAQALVAKLNTIDFTDVERSLLTAILQAAATDDDVEGFLSNSTGSAWLGIKTQAALVEAGFNDGATLWKRAKNDVPRTPPSPT